MATGGGIFSTAVDSGAGTYDSRSFFDGSGWTVSTGRSTEARGGDRTDAASGPWGDAPVIQAGGGNNTLIIVAAIAAVGAVAIALLLRKKRG